MPPSPTTKAGHGVPGVGPHRTGREAAPGRRWRPSPPPGTWGGLGRTYRGAWAVPGWPVPSCPCCGYFRLLMVSQCNMLQGLAPDLGRRPPLPLSARAEPAPGTSQEVPGTRADVRALTSGAGGTSAVDGAVPELRLLAISRLSVPCKSCCKLAHRDAGGWEPSTASQAEVRERHGKGWEV